MAGDVPGMVNDPDFLGLPPVQQREALLKLTGDQAFNSLSDAETMQFTSRLKKSAPAVDFSQNPPAVQAPALRQGIDMQGMDTPQSVLQSGPVGTPAMPSKVPQSIQNAPPEVGEAIAGTALGGGAALAGGAALGPVAKAFPRAFPIAASMAIGEARKIPYVGKFIPPYAELAPYAIGGGKGEAESAPAEASETVPESGTPVKVGTFAKETTNPPYTGSKVPDSMELVDSTNVTKVGYHPDSKTMWVEYRNGRTYTYEGVPKEIFQGAKDAESTGSFIARQIKGRYETTYKGSTLGKKP